ncbi:MAG: helix-turn-helix domain-containing protein [Oscillospiraceae bacterium]
MLDGGKIRISPCSAIFLPAFYPHEYYPEEELWNIRRVVPAGFAAEDTLKRFGLTEPAVFALREVGKLEHIFRKMHEAIRADSFFGAYRASGYLYDFLIEFYPQISAKTASAAPNSALIKAIDYINCNYASEITMDALCDASGVSKQHLCPLFRTTLDTPRMNYTAKRRIQAAKELLTGTEMTIEQIAGETGFCTASCFCKLLRHYEGITPTRFKKQTGKI